LLAHDAASFIEEACAALAGDNAEMERAARARVEASYNWDVNMARVHALLEIPSEHQKSASPCY
jgi:hypothetical protein